MCVRLCVCACMTPARPLTKSNCGGGRGGTRRLRFLPIDHDVCPASPPCVCVSSPLSSSHRCARQSLILHKISAHQGPPSPLYPFLPFYAIPLHWTGERQGGGPGRRTNRSRASLSGASSNLIFPQTDPDRGRLAGNLSFSACTFNTEVIFLDSGYECTHKHPLPHPTVSFLCQIL